MKTPTKRIIQVNTFGIKGVKESIISLYEERVGQVTQRNLLVTGTNRDWLFLYLDNSFGSNINYGARAQVDTSIETMTIDEVLVYLKTLSLTIDVKLNASYTAVVSKDTVKVGCQTFPISVIKEILDASKKLK